MSLLDWKADRQKQTGNTKVGSAASGGIKTTVPGNGGQTDKDGHRPRPRVLREGCGRKLGDSVEAGPEGGGRQERPDRGDCKQSPGERAGHPDSGDFNAGEQTGPQGPCASFGWEGFAFGPQGEVVRFVFQRVSLVTRWWAVRGDQTVGKVICSGDGSAVRVKDQDLNQVWPRV